MHCFWPIFKSKIFPFKWTLCEITSDQINIVLTIWQINQFLFETIHFIKIQLQTPFKSVLILLFRNQFPDKKNVSRSFWMKGKPNSLFVFHPLFCTYLLNKAASFYIDFEHLQCLSQKLFHGPSRVLHRSATCQMFQYILKVVINK